jgi:hypothetical protein
MNLSHWDVAADFTGVQAAALACGIDPAIEVLLPGKSLPLFERMKNCYNSKRDWLHYAIGPHHEEGIIAKLEMLESVSLRGWASEVEPGTWNSYCDWVKAEIDSRFEQQRFKRHELVRWLAEIEFDSQYKFSIDPSYAAQTIQSIGEAGTHKQWTADRLEELALYRDAHGTEKAAAKFKISGARVRKLLPSEKPDTNPFKGLSR